MSFSLQTDGSSGYVQTGNLDGGASFSIILWLKRGRLGMASEFVFSSLGNQGWAVGFGANGNPNDQLFFGKCGVTWGASSSGTIADTTTWHLVVVTYTATQIKFYIDGALDATVNLALTFNSSGDPYQLGARSVEGFFQGKLALAGVVPSVLTLGQVQGLYNGSLDPLSLVPAALWEFREGSGTSTADNSGNGFTGTLTGGVSWQTDIPDVLQPFIFDTLDGNETRPRVRPNLPEPLPDFPPDLYPAPSPPAPFAWTFPLDLPIDEPGDIEYPRAESLDFPAALFPRPKGKPFAGQLIPRYNPRASEDTRHDRLQRHTELVSQILNSLIRKKLLVEVTPGEWAIPSSAEGGVQSVAAAGTQGVTASVDAPTTNPTLTIGLGDITPSSVAATGTVSGSNLSGTNTGDQPPLSWDTSQVLFDQAQSQLYYANGTGFLDHYSQVYKPDGSEFMSATVFFYDSAGFSPQSGYVLVGQGSTALWQDPASLPILSSYVTSDTLAGYSYAPIAMLSSYALTSSLASYVPYTGATSGVNLGTYTLQAKILTLGGATPSTTTALTIQCATANYPQVKIVPYTGTLNSAATLRIQSSGAGTLWVSAPYLAPVQLPQYLFYFDGVQACNLSIFNQQFVANSPTTFQAFAPLGIGYMGSETPPAFFSVKNTVTGAGSVALNLGTVTTNGTTTLVGAGTNFLSAFTAGDTILVSGETVRTISSITDNTHLIATVAFSTTASGLTFTGSQQAVGTSTAFTTFLAAGNTVRIANEGSPFTVSSVISNTVVRFTTAFARANVSAYGYALVNGDAFTVQKGVIGMAATSDSTTGVISQAGTVTFHTYGTTNLFLGAGAGNFTQSGQSNLGVGYNTLAAVTSGYHNVALGPYALTALTTGNDNVGIGLQALWACTTGNQNLGLGSANFYNLTTGSSNVALGFSVLKNLVSGSNNVGIGFEALYHTTGNGNTGIGYAALFNNTTGGNNLAIGYNTFAQNTTGQYNTGFGGYAGYTNTTGDNNTCLGYQADVAGTGQSNSVAIGQGAVSPASNVGVLGGIGTTLFVTWGVCAGQSTAYAYLGGVIFNHYADAGNTTSGETDLYSDTVPANCLAGAGCSLEAVYGGITAAHVSNTRELKVYFGGSVIFDSTAQATATAANWEVRVTIVQDSTTSVRCTVALSDNLNLSTWTGTQYTDLAGLTLSATNVLKITGQGVATNDIVAKLGRVAWLPA